MGIKRCIAPFATFTGGVPRVLAGGDLVDADDPAVEANPSAFEDVESYVEARRGAPVETATADPGQKRPAPSRRTGRGGPPKGGKSAGDGKDAGG